MEEFGSILFYCIGSVVRKKRTQTSRRPRPDSNPNSESHDPSPSDDFNKVSSDENTCCDTGSMRKEFNLNQCISRVSSTSRDQDEKPHKNIKRDDGGFNTLDGKEQGQNGLNNKQSSEGILVPANLRSTSKVKDGLESHSRTTNNNSGRNGETQSLGQSGMGLDVLRHDNKVKKVKLKVGGITCTIHGNSTSNNMREDGSSTRSSRLSDAIRPRPKLILQGNSDDESPPSDKRRGLQGIPWKDFSGGGFNLSREDSSMGKIPGRRVVQKQGDRSEPARKSKRVPKKQQFDDDEDDEIRYLEKLKTFKVNAGFRDDDEEPSKKQRKLSRVSKFGTVEGIMEYTGSSRSGKDRKKSISDRLSDDTDYEEENDQVSDCGLEGKKNPKKESVDFFMDSKKEIALTTRQRALHFGKDASSAPGASLDFPNGLPPAPSRRQKEKLSEVEQQLKKAEAAQRRRTQNEKAARESEAEAIRKILGQDSNRKKREDKIKKRQEELAQEKADNALVVASNTIRWVMGPTGTVVTFSNDLGLPSIFDSKPCRYPPPRENCAGPSCTHPYKYRDSKSKLPLCSLQCYKAIKESAG